MVVRCREARTKMYNGVYTKSTSRQAAAAGGYPHRFVLKKEYMDGRLFELGGGGAHRDYVSLTYRDLSDPAVADAETRKLILGDALLVA